MSKRSALLPALGLLSILLLAGCTSSVPAPIAVKPTPPVNQTPPPGGDPVPPVTQPTPPVVDPVPPVGDPVPPVGDPVPPVGDPVPPVGDPVPPVGDPVPPVGQPTPVIRLALSRVDLTIVPGLDWTPDGETIYALSNGQTGNHLVGQATLVNGQVVFPLPDEAALGATLTAVNTSVPPEPGCMLIQPTTGSGYNVSNFRTTSLMFIARTESSDSGYRQLQEVGSGTGTSHQLIYVDRDVRVLNTVRCVVNGLVDETTNDLDLVKGWNLATITDTGNETSYTHVIKALPATNDTQKLTFVGGFSSEAPTP